MSGKPVKKAKGKPAPSEAALIAQPEPAPGRKIAILGTTPSRMQAPLADDSGWEIWTIGPGGKDAHRWDRLFEVHGPFWPKDFDGYLNDLSLVKKPQQVVTVPQSKGPGKTWDGAIAHWKQTHEIADDVIKGDWSARVDYPRAAIFERFRRRMWFSSSISYCIALAISEQPTDIGLWGIDLESGEEYISQFVGCAHLLDLAHLSGITVHLPEGCGLFRDPNPYPDRYETDLALTLEKKSGWLGEMIGKVEPDYDQLKTEVHRQEGRIYAMEQLGAVAEDITEAKRVLGHNNIHLGQIAAQVNQLKGELNAIQFLRRMYVWGMTEP